MVHPVSNYSLPYELTFPLKPEQAIKFTEIQSSHQFGLALLEALAF